MFQAFYTEESLSSKKGDLGDSFLIVNFSNKQAAPDKAIHNKHISFQLLPSQKPKGSAIHKLKQ